MHFRVIFAAARDGNFPEVMSYIHVSKRTPIPAISITVSLALLFFLHCVNQRGMVVTGRSATKRWEPGSILLQRRVFFSMLRLIDTLG